MNIAWYQLSPRNRRLVLIPIAQKVHVIKAILFPMTYERLQQLISTAYSHYIIIRDLATK